MLNNFFSSVFVNEGDAPPPDFKANFKNELSDIEITDDDVEKVLIKLKPDKSPGPDSVHPKVLRELSNELSRPLRLLFNKTMSVGQLPKSWKVAEVRPIFKKGKKTDPGNYRPVSLTSIICKVFETFVRDALCNHLSENNLLSDSQFGFTKGRFCVSQLLVTINEWFAFIDKKVPVDAAYLDFRKAFDSVPHKRLLSKLSGYGVTGRVHDWIRDFLSNRSQYVSINDSKSKTANVTSGVPQGSVLGPSLFIYFINDLPDASQSLLKIFADDTKVYAPIYSHKDSEALQNSINSLVEWSKLWLISFNGDKCKMLHLGKNNPKHKYSIQNGDNMVTLSETTCEKDLGVHVDPQLTFREHIHKTIMKARSISGIIIRNVTYRNKFIMCTLFKALIRPILEYGNSVWSPLNKEDIDNLERVQRQFTKRIDGLSGLSYQERLNVLKLPSLEFRRIRGDLIEVYKILNEGYDVSTTNTLLKLDTNSITRSNEFKLVKDRVYSRNFQWFFTNRVINMWNKLPNYIVTSETLNMFKNRVDNHFDEVLYHTRLNIA